MLKVIDITQKAPEVENPYSFPLDPFQVFAIDAINKHENVLVTAKTGSGKTLVGEYQIKKSIAEGKRVFYTTPIKSLTNQKFNDLKEMGIDVGIMTGDVKFAPQSQVVVMTTEILCNLIYKKGTPNERFLDLNYDGVNAVIFDEVHYINDPDRGNVWEQCMMLLPKGINLVLLSATISKPEPFGRWLAEVRGTNVHLISTTYRIVPLQHMVGDDVIMDSKDVFHPDVYNRWLKKLAQDEKNFKEHSDRVKERRLGGYDDGPVSRRDVRDHSFIHQLNEKVRDMETKNLLPALVFSFSRANCERYAAKVEPDLLTSSETAAVNNIVEFHLHRFPYVIASPQCHQLRDLLRKGIAFHHSGLLPMLKEIVEILFAKGLVKLLFATETFAVGINMPTKTVVFTSFTKHDERGHRMLRTDEYIQMAGRAGRRGKDTQGFVYYLPDREPSSLVEVQQMMTGRQMTVESRMKFDYDFLLKAGPNWKEIAEKSYWRAQNREMVKGCRREIETARANLDKMKASLTEREIADFDLRSEIELNINNSVNAARKDAQRRLEQWKNAHMGPRWKTAWDTYQAYMALEYQHERMKAQADDLEDYESEVNERINFLVELGFGSLPLSQLAANVHEGHPIIMPLAFHQKLFHGLSTEELVGCLSQFVDTELGNSDESQLTDTLYDRIMQVRRLAAQLAEREAKMQLEFSDWELSSTWIDISIEWFKGGKTAYELCEKYGVQAGNFVRAMLKLANLADEWTTLATITNDVEHLEFLRGIRQRIVRESVVPDSLYLRL